MLGAGLPLLTRTGHGFAGRMAASVLTACGLPELIAESDSAYEALALRLATEPAELARIRAALRGRGHASALFDPVRGTRHLEAAYTEMRRRHRDGLTPANFAVSEADPRRLLLLDPADYGETLATQSQGAKGSVSLA